MEPRYYIKEKYGIFYIYPPIGTEWVAASRVKEEAESMLKEKNEALHTEYMAAIRIVPAEEFMAEDETEPEKPKRKRIPRVLRPTVTLSEEEWATVHSIIRINARTDIANAEKMLGWVDPNPAMDKIKRGMHALRLAEYIKAQADAYCNAIRNPADEDEPF